MYITYSLTTKCPLKILGFIEDKIWQLGKKHSEIIYYCDDVSMLRFENADLGEIAAVFRETL